MPAARMDVCLGDTGMAAAVIGKTDQPCAKRGGCYAKTAENANESAKTGPNDTVVA